MDLKGAMNIILRKTQLTEVIGLSEVGLPPEADLCVVGGAYRALPRLPVPRVPGDGGGGPLLHHADQQLVILIFQLPVASLELLVLQVATKFNVGQAKHVGYITTCTVKVFLFY